MKYIEKFCSWLWQSSANPEKVSLTVKSLGLALVPKVIAFATASCGLGLVCSGVNAIGLQHFVEVASNVVMWILSTIAGIGFLLGFVRKIMRTITPGGTIAIDSNS